MNGNGTLAPAPEQGFDFSSWSDEDVQRALDEALTRSSPTTGDFVKQAASSFAGGLAEIPAAAVDFAGLVAPFVDRRDAHGFAEKIRDLAREALPPVAGLEDSFVADVAQGLGSGVGFLIPGTAAMRVAGALGAGAKATQILSYAVPGVLGAVVEAPAQFYEAEAAGADEGTKWLAFLGGLGVGATEAVPLGRMLQRIDRDSGGTLRRVLVDALTEGAEEFGQEFTQQTLGNLLARYTYDEDRPIMQDAVENGSAGFFSGVLLSALVSGAGRQPSSEASLEPSQPSSGATATPQEPQPVEGVAQGVAEPAIDEQPPPVKVAPEVRARAPGAAGSAVEAEQDFVTRAFGEGALLVNPTDEERAGIAEFAAQRGRRVRFVSSSTGQPLPRSAALQDETGTIFVDTGRQGRVPKRALLFHELVHGLRGPRGTTSAAYQGLVDDLMKAAPDVVATFAAQYGDRYEAAFGRELPEDVRQEEGVAFLAENLGGFLDYAFDHPGALEQIAEKDRTLFQTVVDYVLEALRKLGFSIEPQELRSLRRLRDRVAESQFEKEADPRLVRQLAVRVREALDTTLGEEMPELANAPAEAQAFEVPEGGGPLRTGDPELDEQNRALAERLRAAESREEPPSEPPAGATSPVAEPPRAPAPSAAAAEAEPTEADLGAVRLPTEKGLFGKQVRPARARRETTEAPVVQPNLLDVQPGDLPGQRSILDVPEAAPSKPAPKKRAPMTEQVVALPTTQPSPKGKVVDPAKRARAIKAFRTRMGEIAEGVHGIVPWIQRRGGLRWTKEIEDTAGRASGVLRAPGLGPLVRPKGKGGMSLDDLMHFATEEGFFPGKEVGDITHADLLEAIETNLRTPEGGAAVAEREQAELERQERAMRRDFEDYVPFALPEEIRFALAPEEFDQDARFALPQTDTEEFRRWFGASKVVDEEGRPLVVFHGTGRDFAVFDAGRAGHATGHHTADLGFFFSASADVAKDFTPWSVKDWPPRREYGEGANVKPAFLSLRNPYEMPLAEFKALVASRDRTVGVRQRLEGEGFDGIHIVSEERYRDSLADEYGHDSWVAFRPEQIKSATGNRGTFDPADPDIRHALPTAAEAREQARDLALSGLRTARAFAQRNLTSRGDLPQEAWNAKVSNDARINADMERVNFTARRFRRAAGGELAEDVARQVDLVFKGEADPSTIPEALREPVREMREHVDLLSRHLIDSGLIEGELKAKVERNLGFYATRSYRVFDDPDWAKKVAPEIRNKAKELLRSENPELDDDQAEAMIRALLFEGKAADSPIALLARSKLGSKDLSVLKRREQIAPEIRALFGEYESPLVNYARSVTKMAHMIENHRFLGEVKAAGLGSFLFDEPTIKDGVDYIKRIAADESSVMAPLNGLYTSPEIERAFAEAVTPEQLPNWLRHYLRVNSAVKFAKAPGSLQTQVRNFTSNLGFALAQGHWKPGKLAAAWKSTLTKFGAMNDRAWEDYYLHAVELGVLHESASAGELRDILKDALVRDPDAYFEKDIKSRLARFASSVTDIYSASDDFWKIAAFENEKERYRAAHPEWSEDELERYAAGLVRRTYPTYSHVPRLAKWLRRFPIVGTFTSFPAEVIRIVGNTAQLIRSELKDPNPRVRSIGAQRLAGSIVAALAPGAAALAARALLGMDNDDDENARQFLPPWSRNGQILWLSRGKDGSAKYVDLSYADAWSYLKRPLIAAMRGDSISEAVGGVASELADPFLSLEILAEAMVDVARNKTASGREVFNPADDFDSRATDIAKHLAEPFVPGTLQQLDRVRRSFTGEVNRYGKAFDPLVEIGAMTTGQRMSELDVPQALGFAARDFQERLGKATRILTEVAARRGAVSDGEVQSAYDEMERSRREAWDEMHEAVLAALSLGVDTAQVRETLRASLSDENAELLLRGVYRPYEPSSSFLASYGTTAEDRREFARRRALVMRFART